MLPRIGSIVRYVLAAAGLTAASGAAVGGWSLAIAPRRPRLERITLPAPGDHRALAGLRIGFISDTHIGPTFRGRDLAPAVALLVAQDPDLILIGGDFVSESARYGPEAAAALAPLAKRPRLGALAVLGNHDMECGAEKVRHALRDVGIRALRNEAVEIETGRGSLWIAGVDELTHHNSDAARTFRQIPDGAAVLSLWHEPDLAEQSAAYGAFAQLSGHTHGGQIRFPLVGPLVLPLFGRRYIKGRYDVDGMPLYVSRGAGVYRPPMRFRCPPEVTLITLA